MKKNIFKLSLLSLFMSSPLQAISQQKELLLSNKSWFQTTQKESLPRKQDSVTETTSAPQREITKKEKVKKRRKRSR